MTTIDKPVGMKFDRFDFEQQIMDCWHVTSDIRTVSEYLFDAPLEPNREDKIANMLIGIEALYEAKFDKLFRQFEDLIRDHVRELDRNRDAINKFNYEEIKRFEENHPWTDEQLDKVAEDLNK